MKTTKITFVKYSDSARDHTSVSTLKDFSESFDPFNLPTEIKVLDTQTFDILEPENYDELTSFPLTDSIKGIVLTQMSKARREITKRV